MDFRGTLAPALSISFDCKETEDVRGLPLSNIKEHQIDYIRKAISVGELTFILVYIKPLDIRYRVDGRKVIGFWDRWQKNKGKKGFNYIPIKEMTVVKPNKGIMIDYLEGIEEEFKGVV